MLARTMADTITMPECGWIRKIREALGISARQLAERLGVSQPTVARMEKSEATGTIEMRSLRRAAEAMNCRVVYMIVPQSGSIKDALNDQALIAARRLMGNVSDARAEATHGNLDQEKIARELAEELVRTLSRHIWETDARYRENDAGEQAL